MLDTAGVSPTIVRIWRIKNFVDNTQYLYYTTGCLKQITVIGGVTIAIVISEKMSSALGYENSRVLFLCLQSLMVFLLDKVWERMHGSSLKERSERNEFTYRQN